MDNNSTEIKNEKKKPGIKQWIYFSVTTLLTILFVVWTGYFAVLILILLFLDIYITKKVPWGKWKRKKDGSRSATREWIDAIIFALVGVWVINMFFFQNYQIPSSSLEKSLLVGDFLCVSKVSYGARSPMTPLTLPLTQHTIPVLNIKSYLDRPQLEYKRFKGTGVVKRGDIVVFNYPSGDTVALNAQNDDYYRLCMSEGRKNVWANKERYGEIIYRPVDRRENYVKRCVGLPGETFSMSNDSVFIDGKYVAPAENEQHSYVVQTDGTLISPKVYEELGISNDDNFLEQHEDLRGIDSTTVVRLGLKYTEDGSGLLYPYVFLTKDMINKLAKKPFVKTIQSANAYTKKLAAINGRNFDSPIYPVWARNMAPSGDYPDLWIPKKGATINFDTNVEKKVAIYGRCIKNYEFNDFDYRDGKVYINGKEAQSYTFKLDYYWMMGDNRDNSADSRLWGFVPEDHIVGQPLFVWLSIDKDKSGFSKIRWNRLFTTGNKK